MRPGREPRNIITSTLKAVVIRKCFNEAGAGAPEHLDIFVKRAKIQNRLQ